MSQFNDQMNKKAVALSYDEDTNSAPVIVASGSGYMAQKIVETARKNGIPVYEDNSLATMLSQLELGSEIPEQLYQAIVDIYVYFLNFATKGTKKTAEKAEEATTGNASAPKQNNTPAQNQENVPAQSQENTPAQNQENTPVQSLGNPPEPTM